MNYERRKPKAKPEVSGKPSSAHRVEKVCELGGEVGRAHVRPVPVLVAQPGLELGPPAGDRHQVARLVHHGLQILHHPIEGGQVLGVERSCVNFCRPTAVGAVVLVIHLGRSCWSKSHKDCFVAWM